MKINWTSVFQNKTLWVCLVIAAVIGSLGVVLNRSQLVVIGAVYTLVCIGYFAWYTGSSSRNPRGNPVRKGGEEARPLSRYRR